MISGLFLAAAMGLSAGVPDAAALPEVPGEYVQPGPKSVIVLDEDGSPASGDGAIDIPPKKAEQLMGLSNSAIQGKGSSNAENDEDEIRIALEREISQEPIDIGQDPDVFSRTEGESGRRLRESGQDAIIAEPPSLENLDVFPSRRRGRN